eukprot:5168-Heterococcus_DN1.PRE.2
MRRCRTCCATALLQALSSVYCVKTVATVPTAATVNQKWPMPKRAGPVPSIKRAKHLATSSASEVGAARVPESKE